MEHPKTGRLIFWQAPAMKYLIKDVEIPNYAKVDLRIDEVFTPFDIYMESIYMQNCFGSIFHQQLVKSGLERIFSVRRADRMYPLCDIITIPKGARILSPAWAMRRALQTSKPMTIDGQKLIVCETIIRKEKRASGALLDAIKKFFLHYGGELKGEHPNYLAMKSPKMIKKWQKIVQGNEWQSLLVSSTPVEGCGDAWAVNKQEACTFLRCKWWWFLYLNGDENMAGDVLGFLMRHPESRPCGTIIVMGQSDKANYYRKVASEIMRYHPVDVNL